VDRSNADRSVTAQATTVRQWNSAESRLKTELAAFASADAACGQKLTCVNGADAKVAADLSAFVRQVRAIAMPSGAVTAAATLVADATKTSADYATLSHATTAARYQSDEKSTNVNADGTALVTDVKDVADALDNS
jgi:hypothetical protein